MKNIVTNIKTLVLAIIGIVGGLLWAVLSHWEPEPIILVSVSIIEIIAFGFLTSSSSSEEVHSPTSKDNRGDVTVSVNVGNVAHAELPVVHAEKVNDRQINNIVDDREAIIELMKSKIKIQFIDDDKNFNVVKILKNGGWRFTKSTTDIKSIEVPLVKDANIHFVDINGVGKLLSLQYEGLDLALMIKERYPDKKVIIYSANRNSNAFHKAWDVCDFKLEKNALPSQFQNIVEQCSIELYNKYK